MSLSNIFTLEGPDGVGKTTVTKLLVEALKRDGRKVTHVRLPGTTPLGEACRELLLMRKDIQLSPMEAGLIFTATHVSVMNLALELAKTQVVIMDRSYWSNYAYRTAEGMPPDVAMSYNQFLPFEFDLAHSLLLTAPLDVLKARLSAARGDKPDRFEGRGDGFQQRVYEGYSVLLGIGRLTPIDANRPPEDVARDLCHHVVAHSQIGRQQQVFE